MEKSIKAQSFLSHGHTHIPEEVYVDNILFINPGSLGRPVYPNSNSYALLIIENNQIRVEFKNPVFRSYHHETLEV